MNMSPVKRKYAGMCIENILKFTLPIGWDEVGVIATALAVIVALYANRKATQQLKSALEMQEQSKNVGLLDKRIELAEKIQSGKSVSELTLQVLFNDEIFKDYKDWQNHLSEKVYAEHDLEMFFHLSMTPDGEGGYTDCVQKTIYKYMTAMSKDDCPQQTIDEYKVFCNQHTFWERIGETGEQIPYNHAEISDRIAKAISGAKKEQEFTLQLVVCNI